ncbi:MAG: ChuX/HutX family heme-like substrate-binding protein [Fusobacteriaceae bacterium]
MKKEIENILKNQEGISLSEVSKKLNIPYLDVLKNSPSVRKYDTLKINELFEILQSWEKVFLLVVTENFVLEIKDKFPKGFYAHGFLNFHDSSTSIGGHLTTSSITDIYLVSDYMFGRKSCSIKFYNNDKEVFAIYVPRGENKEFIATCLESFYNL